MVHYLPIIFKSFIIVTFKNVYDLSYITWQLLGLWLHDEKCYVKHSMTFCSKQLFIPHD
jgi:hypothetical protein